MISESVVIEVGSSYKRGPPAGSPHNRPVVGLWGVAA